jgi:hypothetical protein
MKVSREKLYERLRLLIENIEDRQSLYGSLEKNWGIPISMSFDVCSKKRDISEVPDFIAFALLSELQPRKLSTYFTDTEIENFSKQRYKKPDINKDISVFKNMIRVSDDQWIGTIMISHLMKLKDAQLINYNKNTQRSLKQVINGDNRYYKIALNWNSVKEIKAAMENGSYVPNDITLNVPVEQDEYNENERTIAFNTPKQMDILDGYHRYIAISQLLQEHPDVDFPMELRIVSFSEEKAKQFIFQNDQKTQMKKVDSAALNQYNPANQVVEDLNSSASSNLQGQISRNDGNISFSFLSALITYYYFRDKNKKYTIKDRVNVTNDLKGKFNALTSKDIDWLDHRYSNRELHVIMFCFSHGVQDASKIRKVLNESEKIDSRYLRLGKKLAIQKRLITDLTKILEEVRHDTV